MATNKPTIGLIGAPNGNALYQGENPNEWEQRSKANNGFGVRMGARIYWRKFADLFKTGGNDTRQFAAGADVHWSVSNFEDPGFTYKSWTGKVGPKGDGTDDTAGAGDTILLAALNRLKALPYDSAVTGSSYGGYTRSKTRGTIQHEVNATNKVGAYGSSNAATPGEFIAFWRWFCHLAEVVGVRKRLDMTLTLTAWGIDHNTVEQFWPDDASGKYVDTIGSDMYVGFNSSWTYGGSLDSFTKANAGSLAYARAKGKALSYPEFDIAESGNDAQMKAWLVDMAVQITAITDVPITGVFGFAQASNSYQNWNKVAAQDPTNGKAHAGKHDGMQALVDLGGNADLASPQAAVPSKPVILSYASAPDGTYIDVTIAAALPGETVVGRDWYMSPGETTNLKRVSTSSTAPGVLTYRFATDPAKQYSISCVAFNDAGRSGYGTIITPVTNSRNNEAHAPYITGASVAKDDADPYKLTFLSSAVSPDGNPITFHWDFAGPGGVVAKTLDLASGVVKFDTPGGYTGKLTVKDNSTPPLVDTATITFSVDADESATDLGIWIPRSNDPVLPGLGSGLRAAHRAINGYLKDLRSRRSGANSLVGLVGSTFDPGLLSGAGVFIPSNGSLMWAAIKLEGTSITAVDLLTSVAQVGNASAALSFHDAAGNLLTLDNAPDGLPAVFGGTAGGDVDTYLKATPAAGATAPPAPLVLSTPIVNRTFGEVVVVQLYVGTATTQASLRAGTAPSVAAKAGGNSARPRWGSKASVTGLAPVVPWADWAGINHPYIGLIGPTPSS